MADAVMTLAQIEQAMAERFRLHPAKAQFTRSADSAKWFRPRGVKMAIKRWHFYVYLEPATSVRAVAHSVGVAGTFPDAQALTYLQMSWDDDDLTMFQGTGSINVQADFITRDAETHGDMVYRLATKVIGEIILDFDEKLNQSIHMNTAATMALVDAKYDEDGTAWNAGQTDAFIKIKGGQIAMFHQGMKISFDNNETATVKDVVHGNDGPWISSEHVSDIGPGIVVEIISGTNFNGVDADDVIARTGETTGSNFGGFPTWFDATADVYNDGDGSAITRAVVGSQWQIPEIFVIAAAGSEVDLDLDDHFRQIADVLPRRMKTGRNMRKKLSPEAAINAPSSLVLITTNELTNEATQTIADTQRFTTESAKSMDAAKRKALFGDVGFEGTVWHSPTLGPIAIQTDATAEPFKMTLIDPTSWFMLYLGQGKTAQTLDWVPNPGASGRWHPVYDTKKLTLQQQCGAYMECLLACDQPGANAQLRGVKSSLY